MSKYNRNEAEPFVAGSIIAAEHLMDEARANAFGPPSITVTDCTFWSGKPLSVDIDRDKDGKVDAKGYVTYSTFGYIDKIDVKGTDGSKQYSIQFNRTLGAVNHAKLDLKADGTDEATFYPNYAWFSNKVHGLKIDTNGDKVTDQRLSFSRGFFSGLIRSAKFDNNDDKKIDNYYDVKRHWFSSNLATLEARKE